MPVQEQTALMQVLLSHSHVLQTLLRTTKSSDLREVTTMHLPGAELNLLESQRLQISSFNS